MEVGGTYYNEEALMISKKELAKIMWDKLATPQQDSPRSNTI